MNIFVGLNIEIMRYESEREDEKSNSINVVIISREENEPLSSFVMMINSIKSIDVWTSELLNRNRSIELIVLLFNVKEEEEEEKEPARLQFSRLKIEKRIDIIRRFSIINILRRLRIQMTRTLVWMGDGRE